MYRNINECIHNRYNTSCTNDRYKDFHQDIYTTGDQEQFINEIGIPEKHVVDTFRYIYNKFKKGIFVIIKDNQMKFIPFDNHNFINDYENYMDIENIDVLIKKVSTNDKQKIKPFIEWYSNNGIFRYEKNKKEIDKTSIILKNMLETLCLTRKVPDCYFFVNRRDFPWLRKDRNQSLQKCMKKYLYQSFYIVLIYCYTNFETLSCYFPQKITPGYT